MFPCIIDADDDEMASVFIVPSHRALNNAAARKFRNSTCTWRRGVAWVSGVSL